MKSNKGITIISLLIYIIVLSIVIGTISMLMKYFYENTDETVVSDNPFEQYSRFVTYLSSDINSENIKDFTNTQYEITFNLNDGKTSHIYAKEGSKIYYKVVQENSSDKKIELCNRVGNNYSIISTNNKIEIQITLDGNEYKNVFYTKAINSNSP